MISATNENGAGGCGWLMYSYRRPVDPSRDVIHLDACAARRLMKLAVKCPESAVGEQCGGQKMPVDPANPAPAKLELLDES